MRIIPGKNSSTSSSVRAMLTTSIPVYTLSRIELRDFFCYTRSQQSIPVAEQSLVFFLLHPLTTTAVVLLSLGVRAVSVPTADPL